MENMVALSYLGKNERGDEQSRYSGIIQSNLELFHIKTDYFYCEVPTRNFECGGRLRVQKCEGLKQMDVEQGNLPKTLLRPRQIRDRSLCIESVEITEVRRNDHGQTLLGLIKPHKPVTSSTVSRLIVDMIRQFGISTDIVKGQST